MSNTLAHADINHGLCLLLGQLYNWGTIDEHLDELGHTLIKYKYNWGKI